MDLRLSDGNRVCIVGGGPAGSFAALHLLRLASRQNLRLEVLIFEPRNFLQPGPAGCNRCAGILSSRLLRGLDELEMPLPTEIIQAELRAYAVKLGDKVLRIERPDPGRRIVSVYRGSGPRLLQGEPVVSFDGYLLSQACPRGAQHIPTRVRQVIWEDRPVVQTVRDHISADLLVLATGVNSRAPLAPVFGYDPPKTEIMAQDEILRPPTWPDDQVNIFFQRPPNLIFGALIPKGPYLNISLLGHKLTRDAVSEFIEAQGPGARLSSASVSLCGCTPRVAVGDLGSAARTYCGARWMAVGDAAVTRLYKDGIGSAFFTAKNAMQTALEQGISARAVRKTYVPFCRRVAMDNLYGRMLFRMWDFVLHTPPLLRAWTAVIEQEGQAPAGEPEGYPWEQRIHTRILWGMFTGDELYRDLFRLALSPKALYGLVRGWRHAR